MCFNHKALTLLCVIGLAGGLFISATQAQTGGTPPRMLLAPAERDTPDFRAAVAALTGGPVEYMDVRIYTPTLEQLLQYDCVLTWPNYAYADREAMGDVLADYVDAGGRVILGQFCFHCLPINWLGGRIMTPEYCPVASLFGVGPGSYNGDGSDCVHAGVSAYACDWFDRIHELQPGAQTDGTLTCGSQSYPAVVWRADRRVYFSPGNTGGRFGTGDWVQLTANMCLCPGPASYGSCCDAGTGVCTDDVTQADCRPHQWRPQSCADLAPPCGNPGACCNDPQAACMYKYEINCDGRHMPGVPAGGAVEQPCLEDPFPAPCGEPVSLLCAPGSMDNSVFRESLAQLLGGPVDYLDAGAVTPSLDLLLQYDCVLTWSYCVFDDYLTYGAVLADYVDLGGRVILGDRSYCGFSDWPCGEAPARILDAEYCPAKTVGSFAGRDYAGDGQDCVHTGVLSYAGNADVVVTLQPGARWDGTIGGYPSVVWRPDRRVYFSNGHAGMLGWTHGDWARLTANMCTCPALEITGDLNCDGAVNVFDIDPFVLALTSPEYSYAPQYPHCDYMLADCNGDGVVNAFDIDPFVALLVGAPVMSDDGLLIEEDR